MNSNFLRHLLMNVRKTLWKACTYLEVPMLTERVLCWLSVCCVDWACAVLTERRCPVPAAGSHPAPRGYLPSQQPLRLRPCLQSTALRVSYLTACLLDSEYLNTCHRFVRFYLKSSILQLWIMHKCNSFESKKKDLPISLI